MHFPFGMGKKHFFQKDPSFKFVLISFIKKGNLLKKCFLPAKETPLLSGGHRYPCQMEILIKCACWDSFFHTSIGLDCLLGSCDHGIQNLWNSWPKIIILKGDHCILWIDVFWLYQKVPKSEAVRLLFHLRISKLDNSHWFFRKKSSWKRSYYSWLLRPMTTVYIAILCSFLGFQWCAIRILRDICIFLFFSGSAEFPRSNAIEAAILPLGDE